MKLQRPNRFSLPRFPEPKSTTVAIIVGEMADERLASVLTKERRPDRFRVHRLIADPHSDPSGVLASLTDDMLLVLVTPSIAETNWLCRIVEAWLARRPSDSLCFGLTDGDIAWNSESGSFDWAITTALPMAVAGFFSQQPVWVDLRASRDRANFRLRDLTSFVSKSPLPPLWGHFFASPPISLLELTGRFFSREGARRHQERVYLGASSPATVTRGTEFTARFVAYQYALQSQIENLIKGVSPQSGTHLGMKYCNWHFGTTVTVKLQGRYIGVACDSETFRWEGNYNVLEFDVEVAPTAPECITVLKFDVLVADVVVARLRLDLEIRDTQGDSFAVRRSSVETSSTAFASYASEDRARVLDRVAELEKMISLDVFLDCLSLHPGDHWKKKLEEEIIGRDLFMLFWSKHASTSEWVRWEWETALRKKGIAAIDPHPLDPPDEAKPPKELQCLHFGDKYMLVRRGIAARGI